MGAPFRVSPVMSSRKLAALDFIKRYFAEWGRGPSLGELAAALSVSKQRAHNLVQQLSAEQQIRHEKGKTRGIYLVDRQEEFSQADALVRLAQAGWTVIVGDRQISAPLTDRELPGLPFLDHDPAACVDVSGPIAAEVTSGAGKSDRDTERPADAGDI